MLMKRNLKLLIAVLITFLLFVNLASAYTYLNIYVDETGNALFLGETNEQTESLNFPEGIEVKNGDVIGGTQELTSKQGEVWSFSYFLEGAEINVVLPKGAIIEKIEGNESSIAIDNGRISVYVGDKANISYKVKVLRDYTAIVILAVLIILAVLGYLFFSRMKKQKGEKRKKPINARKNKEKRIEILKQVLNEREKLIIEKLKEHKEIKSSILRKLCDDMPKASFSRHIRELEKKGLIRRKGEGRNKIVSLR